MPIKSFMIVSRLIPMC